MNLQEALKKLGLTQQEAILYINLCQSQSMTGYEAARSVASRVQMHTRRCLIWWTKALHILLMVIQFTMLLFPKKILSLMPNATFPRCSPQLKSVYQHSH